MSDHVTRQPAQQPAAVAPPQPLTLSIWLILIMASIGFAFDIYELLMLPLVLPPALAELLPGVRPGSDEFNLWRALMFWVPAMAGGLFGMLGGYLTDYLGRRRVLTWSILLYAVSAFLAGFSTNMWMLLVLRSTTFVGVCVEFVAAVAWLAELFPNPEQREKALGYTQAFSSLGGLMVSGAFLLIAVWAPYLPAVIMPAFLEPVFGPISGTHAPWRYTLMSGLIPAIPLIIIRPFLPESPIWQRKKETGTLKRPSFAELFSPALNRTTIITTIMVACSYGAAFGAIQQVPQIVPGLPQVQSEVAPKVAAALEKAEPELNKVAEQAATKARQEGEDPERAASRAREAAEARIRRQTAQPIYGKHAGQIALGQEIGGLIGRFVLAFLAVIIVSRQSLIRLFQVPGVILMPFIFAYAGVNNATLFQVGQTSITLLHVGLFLAGLLTVAQFSFWGNYLPRVYPTHLRGTGESFAHNVGGRMLGTSFAAVTSLVSGLAFIPGNDDPTRVAYTAGGVALFVYLVGLLCSYLLPEPREETFTE